MNKRVNLTIPFEVRTLNENVLLFSGNSVMKFFKKAQLLVEKITVLREYEQNGKLIKHVQVDGYSDFSLRFTSLEYLFLYDPPVVALTEASPTPPTFRFIMNQTLVFSGSLEQFEKYLYKHYYVLSIEHDIGNIEELIAEGDIVKAKAVDPVITMQYQKEKDVVSCVQFKIKPNTKEVI